MERNKVSYLPLRRLHHPHHQNHQGHRPHRCQSNFRRSHCHIPLQRRNLTRQLVSQRLTAPRHFFPGRWSVRTEKYEVEITVQVPLPLRLVHQGSDELL